jgi:hypothetical protein
LSSLLRIALCVLVIGFAGILIAPFLFTRKGYISFADTGEIGDTIGGITSPITSIVGSILVFLALRAQVLTNQVTQAQIHERQTKEQTRKEVNYVSELYHYFTNNIQHYETKYFRGHRAIMRTMSLLAKREREKAHDDGYLYYGTAAELYSILKLGKLFLEQVKKAKIDEHDKQYFKELVKHHYDSFIMPYLVKSSKGKCTVCGEKHNGIPMKMVAVIEETMLLLN